MILYSPCLVRSHDKLDVLYHHMRKTNRHHNGQRGDLSWGTFFPLSLMALWSGDQRKVTCQIEKIIPPLLVEIWKLNLAECQREGGSSKHKCLSCHHCLVWNKRWWYDWLEKVQYWPCSTLSFNMELVCRSEKTFDFEGGEKYKCIKQMKLYFFSF